MAMEGEFKVQLEPKRFAGACTEGIVCDSGCNSLVSAREVQPVKRVFGRQVPPDILDNSALNTAISLLPSNYNFEIHKTVWRIRSAGAKHVALQFPEGLLMYACIIADILESFAGVLETFIMGDVTFGACCVDDFSASALGADFLVHYGHSCLVPVDVTQHVPAMYVFVDIKIDIDHLVGCIKATFPPNSRLLLAGTIQFAASVAVVKQKLSQTYPDILIPRSSPLSPGEVLGCTAPRVSEDHIDALIFVADGRFHLEALMMANPSLPAYRYDPYGRILTKEGYDHDGMRISRRFAIEKAKSAKHWGLILGTLGRQGNPAILDRLQKLLETRQLTYVTILLSEVSPQKLHAMRKGIDAWVQVACPRLSIDWGDEFSQPTLTPYEAYVALGETPGWWEKDEPYPMDYYSSEGGPWNSVYPKAKTIGSGSGKVAALLAARRRQHENAPAEQA